MGNALSKLRKDGQTVTELAQSFNESKSLIAAALNYLSSTNLKIIKFNPDHLVLIKNHNKNDKSKLVMVYGNFKHFDAPENITQLEKLYRRFRYGKEDNS